MSRIQLLPITKTDDRGRVVIDPAALQANLDTLQNAINGQIGAANVYPASLTDACMAALTLRRRSMSTDIPSVAAGTYAGDNVANRVTTTADPGGNIFTARWVLVMGNGITFESLYDGTTTTSWWRTTTGDLSSDAANWQGIVTGGFKCGSNASCISNLSGQMYAYIAVR